MPEQEPQAPQDDQAESPEPVEEAQAPVEEAAVEEPVVEPTPEPPTPSPLTADVYTSGADGMRNALSAKTQAQADVEAAETAVGEAQANVALAENDLTAAKDRLATRTAEAVHSAEGQRALLDAFIARHSS